MLTINQKQKLLKAKIAFALLAAPFDIEQESQRKQYK
jgi:hypothetical protein